MARAGTTLVAEAVVLRRVFPPARILTSFGRGSDVAHEASDWWTALRSPLLPVLPSRLVYYTAPPRSRWEHTWGSCAMALRGRRLLDVARRFGPDVVHGHWAIPSGDVAVRIARALGVPCVVSVHGYDIALTPAISGAARLAVKRVLSGADLVIANSRQTREAAAVLTGGNARIRTLWQGGDAVAASCDIGSPARIATIGHLYDFKGASDAVTALGRCRAAGLDFRWTLVGSASRREMTSVMHQIREAGLADITRCVPQMPNAEVLDLLAASDILLHLPAREAYGIVVAEALGAGAAVVGSAAAGAIQDFGAHGGPVISVPANDPAAAAAAIAALIGEPERLREVKKASAEWGRANLGWDRYSRRLADAYEELVASNGGGDRR